MPKNKIWGKYEDRLIMNLYSHLGRKRTIEEISKYLKCTPSQVDWHLQVLLKKERQENELKEKINELSKVQATNRKLFESECK